MSLITTLQYESLCEDYQILESTMTDKIEYLASRADEFIDTVTTLLDDIKDGVDLTESVETVEEYMGYLKDAIK